MIYEKGIVSYNYYIKCLDTQLINKKSLYTNNKYDWVKSIIVYVFPYSSENKYDDYLPAKFAYGKDYHLVVKEFLEEEAKKNNYHKYETFVDVSFLNEKLCACLSGLGVKGKNDLFISKKFGSFVVIGEIIVDEELPSVEYNIERCLDCNLCVKACPNNALANGFDKTKCLSYLNQRPSSNFELYDNMKNYYGCDICQNVCPMNDSIIRIDNFGYDDKAKIDLKKLEAIVDYKKFANDKTYNWIGYLKMLRNILVIECNKQNIDIEKLEYYQKKYKSVKWFYDHLEYLKGRIRNNG